MTTERILPAIALPRPALREAGPATRVEPRPRSTTAGRSQPFLSTPARAGILFGASAAVYAVSLAAVATFQAADEAAITARSLPYADTVARTRAANDALERSLLAADAEARSMADRYARVGDDLAAYEARLDALATLVADVEGSAAALPTRIGLPKVTTRGAISSGRAPSTTTSSGASGG